MAALKEGVTLRVPSVADGADADASASGQMQAACEVEQPDVMLEAGLHDGCGTSLQLMQRATSMPVRPEPAVLSDMAGEYCMRLVGGPTALLAWLKGLEGCCYRPRHAAVMQSTDHHVTSVTSTTMTRHAQIVLTPCMQLSVRICQYVTSALPLLQLCAPRAAGG